MDRANTRDGQRETERERGGREEGREGQSVVVGG